MADTTTVKEITKKLEAGIRDIFDSGKYTDYLKTMSKFHRYSARNIMLIHMQKPDATRVAGYNAWKNNFKRQVKRGAKAIKILAPTPFIVKEEREVLDPQTKKPVIGEDGNPVREEIEIKAARFKAVNVFDFSQTFGEPLPELAETLTGNVERYELFMDALRAASPLPIQFDNLPEGNDGRCTFGEAITIRNGMSEIQTVCAVIHEITHAKLHDLETLRLADEKATPKDRRTEEVEAESVSYAVCQYYGIETGANSFGYLAEWSKTRELKELSTSLETIRKAAAELIDSIDEQYRDLAKERGIDLTADAPAKVQDIPAPDVPRVEPAALSANQANLVIGEDDEVRVTFDSDGNIIVPDEQEKQTAFDELAEQLESAKGIFLKEYPGLSVHFTDMNEDTGDIEDRTPFQFIADIEAQNGRHEWYYNEDSVKWVYGGFVDALGERLSVHCPTAEELHAALGIAMKKQYELDMLLPDPTVTIMQMREYGYEDSGMLPLSESWALQFYDSNNTVYLLYPDNTEAMALDREEIANHDGLLGIERGDWERSPEYAAMLAEAANAEGKREADLLYGDNRYYRENKFGIYQVRDNSGEARDFRFVPMRELEALGLPVERKNYELVYTAPLSERIEFLSDRYPALNKIYEDFNLNQPADYAARSISVSDVIVLRHNGDFSAFYVDSAGFNELDGFFGDETERGQMKTPEKPNPTVTELEADVKAGQSISIMDLANAVKAERKHISKGRPSLLGRLDEAKRQVEQGKQTAAAANKSERGH